MDVSQQEILDRITAAGGKVLGAAENSADGNKGTRSHEFGLAYAKKFSGRDIIHTETSDPKEPLMYCATGPGNANWEPRVVSFCYGFLKSQDSEGNGLYLWQTPDTVTWKEPESQTK